MDKLEKVLVEAMGEAFKSQATKLWDKHMIEFKDELEKMKAEIVVQAAFEVQRMVDMQHAGDRIVFSFKSK